MVIPVYNEEKYLKWCIDALLKQIEFITEVVVVVVVEKTQITLQRRS
ncbi:glycosyltransferase family A protein [Rhodococcus sp. 1.20]|nr:glycosyltransferase family 2 protein [Rhodococcus qingshengii]MCC4303761.1 glycosyltransferase family 2 protein [Rhodococcus sp. 3-2]QEM28123.1 glycosyltransferase family 2 protein [Rhodococcus qingshengii]